MISLYQCLNTGCKDGRIRCKKGYKLMSQGDGSTRLSQLKIGRPLEFTVCQQCPDFSSLGDSIPEEERGWV